MFAVFTVTHIFLLGFYVFCDFRSNALIQHVNMKLPHTRGCAEGNDTKQGKVNYKGSESSEKLAILNHRVKKTKT